MSDKEVRTIRTADLLPEYSRNPHRLAFLMNPSEELMAVDYGPEITEEEMQEAGIQILTNILSHIPSDRKEKAFRQIVEDVRSYMDEDGKEYEDQKG